MGRALGAVLLFALPASLVLAHDLRRIEAPAAVEGQSPLGVVVRHPAEVVAVSRDVAQVDGADEIAEHGKPAGRAREVPRAVEARPPRPGTARQANAEEESEAVAAGPRMWESSAGARSARVIVSGDWPVFSSPAAIAAAMPSPR